FFQAEDGIRDRNVTGVQTCALPILRANIFHFREGVDERQDFYFDVADIHVQDDVWSTRDLYVDLVSVTGEPIDVQDIDELAAAKIGRASCRERGVGGVGVG